MKTVRVENISKQFRNAGVDERAVDDVSLTVDAGEFFFLLGPSGCGKTTLLRMIAGLTEPTAGRVFLDSDDVTDVPVDRRATSLVFQNYALWPHMTVTQNVQFGPRMQRLPRRQRLTRTERMLELVQMTDYAKRKPVQLSGGQQQRVALARALAAQPACLLLDEPLSNLDAKLRLEMRSSLRSLVKEAGMTAIYVTHDQTEALSMADRIAVMQAGQVRQVGTPMEVYTHPATRFVADFLGEANFIEGTLAQAGSPAQVETPAGMLIAPASPEGLCSGMEVTCCVRPEWIELLGADANEEADTSGRFRATVTGRVFLGEVAQLTMRLTSGEAWKVTVRGDELSRCPSVGEAATLRIPADRVVLLTE
jgi:ABC-type Fe3+/spermidine/putrescine transport system ATPase subunit